jgi:hypothetical protein
MHYHGLTTMSDAKPRRGGREAARDQVARAEAAPIESPPMIAPEMPPMAQPAATPAAAEPVARDVAVAEDAWTTLAQAQAALVRGLEEAAIEMTGMTRGGLAASTDAGLALLGAKSFAEIVEINAGLTRRGVDVMIEGSARLSEIGAKAVADASRPLLSRLGAPWNAAGTG